MGNMSFCRQAPGYNSCSEDENQHQYVSGIEPCAIQIMFNVTFRGKPTSPFVGGSIGDGALNFFYQYKLS